MAAQQCSKQENKIPQLQCGIFYRLVQWASFIFAHVGLLPLQYFSLAAVKAVDALMESHWAKEGKNGEEPMFTCREDVVDFLERYAITQMYFFMILYSNSGIYKSMIMMNNVLL